MSRHVRYVGDAVVTLICDPSRDYVYHGWVKFPGGMWKFDELRPSPHAQRTMAEDSPDLIDKLATSAVSFGSDEGTNPDSWQEVEEAVIHVMDDRGEYEVHRTRRNPAGLTAKGERMYEHVKRSYAGDPRAKEIASRTVLARAKGGARGLRRRNPVSFINVGARVEVLIDQPGRQARLTEGVVVELEGDQALVRVQGGREVWLPQNRLRPITAEAAR